MSDLLDKVRKLIALSASPVEEEARSAAYLACRLIREQHLEVRSPFADATGWKHAENVTWGARKPPPERTYKFRVKPSRMYFGAGIQAKCKMCGVDVLGGWLLWMPNRGFTHERCEDYWYE